MAGIEPATDGLRNRCSTAELHWRPRALFSLLRAPAFEGKVYTEARMDASTAPAKFRFYM